MAEQSEHLWKSSPPGQHSSGREYEMVHQPPSRPYSHTYSPVITGWFFFFELFELSLIFFLVLSRANEVSSEGSGAGSERRFNVFLLLLVVVLKLGLRGEGGEMRAKKRSSPQDGGWGGMTLTITHILYI